MNQTPSYWELLRTTLDDMVLDPTANRNRAGEEAFFDSPLLSERCHSSFLSPSVLNLWLGLSIMTPIGQQLWTLIDESCAAREDSSHDRGRTIASF